MMVKLGPSPEQHKMLCETMKRFNEACNHIAETVFALHSANKVEIHKTVYYPVRDQFGLSSQLTIRAISKVCEAYKRDKSIKPEFRPDGAIVYDQRILSWKGLEKVSLITLQGRQTIPVRLGEYQKARLDRIRGQADLILVNGIFYLCVVVEVDEETPYDPKGTLGVDLGIKYLAVDSDGEVHSGEQINQTRERLDSLKARLQSKGTKSAKRHLKKLSGRTAKFSKDVTIAFPRSLLRRPWASRNSTLPPAPMIFVIMPARWSRACPSSKIDVEYAPEPHSFHRILRGIQAFYSPVIFLAA